jgi:hypothetical protein
MPDSDIHRGIVATLSDFARNITRYYNLEVVTEDAVAATVMDPMAAWTERVTILVLAAHDTPRRREKRHQQAQLAEEIIGDRALVRFHTESGGPVSTVLDATTLSAITEFCRPYERMYVLQIARFIASVLNELGYEAQRRQLGDIPYLADFFAHFRNEDSYLRSRKTWSLY